MPQIACSTALCPLPAVSGQILARWEGLARGAGVEAMAIDPRLSPGLQQEVLHAARARGIRCSELAHPQLGPSGLRAASPASGDRDERAAASAQLLDTVQRAAGAGVERVLLPPVILELSQPRAALARRFALGLELASELEQLEQERAERGRIAIDALCLVLDPVLRRLDPLGGTLVLQLPAPWPHQLPSAEEVAALARLFAGAPLGICHATDWAHVAAALGVEAEAQAAEPTVLRLADACGLSTRLPVGTGEIDWPAALAAFGDGGRPPCVIVCRAEVEPSPAEMQQAVALVSR
jgi:sugar phosphate isomerase/epimerase